MGILSGVATTVESLGETKTADDNADVLALGKDPASELVKLAERLEYKLATSLV